jgi:N-acetylglucosaminyl-diphospho-decaprenol L-rhamnosyltransferase
VSGCFLLIERSKWESLGGFDPAFFMYGEEADLCLRAHRLGAKPMVTPQATIIHYGGASEKVRSDKMARLLSAKVRLIRCHWPRPLVNLGVALLSLWPLSRWIAWSFLSPIRGEAAKVSAKSWGDIWRRRSEWLAA